MSLAVIPNTRSSASLRESETATPAEKPVESFAVDSGDLVRYVQRRSGAQAKSVVAPWNGSGTAVTGGDADLAFLRRTVRPVWSVGSENVPFVDLFCGLG